MTRTILAAVMVATLWFAVPMQSQAQTDRQRWSTTQDARDYYLDAERRGQRAFDRWKAEHDLWKTLESPAQNFDFFEAPLSDVMARVQDDHRFRIDLDEDALSKAKIGTDTLVTASHSDIPLRVALDVTLADHNLGWVIVEGRLIVTTRKIADNHLYRRVYAVQDLVQNDPQRGATEVAELIRTTISPESWRGSSEEATKRDVQETVSQGAVGAVNGMGTIVVLNTRAVQQEVEVLLLSLREAKQQAAGVSEVVPASK